MAFPLMVFLAAFNASPGDPTNIPVWTDLTSRVTSIAGYARGKQYEIDQGQAGSATISMNNPDEALNPSNPSSPYAPNVQPYRPATVMAVWPAAGTGNLLSFMDPGFEASAVGTTPIGDINWILFGSAVVSSAQAFQGVHSLAIPIVTNTVFLGFRWRLLMVPGKQYTFSCYVRQAVANTIQVGVATDFSSPPAGYVASSSTTTTTGAWVRLTVTFTATQPLQQIWIHTNGGTTADTLYVDAIQLEQGAAATTWTTTGAQVYSVLRGYMERWPETWKAGGKYGLTPAVWVDALAVLSQQPLGTEVYNTTQNLNPTLYWPLQDQASAVACAESSGNGGPPLLVTTSTVGAGNGMQLGVSTPDLAGDVSGSRAQFKIGSLQVPAAMDCQLLTTGTQAIGPLPTVGTSPWSITLTAWGAVNPLTISNVVDRNIVLGLPATGTQQTLIDAVCPATGAAQGELQIGVVGQNLLSPFDPSFETQTVGQPPFYWSGLLIGAMSVTNAQAFDGSKSLQWPVGGGSGFQGLVFQATNLTVGQQYVFSTYVRMTAANTVQMFATSSPANPPPSTFDYTGVSTAAVGSWNRIWVIFNADAETMNIWVATPSPANNATVYIDAIQMETGPYASIYQLNGYAPAAVYAAPNGVNVTAVANRNMADGQMHHYAATYVQNSTQTTVTLYVDGSQVAQTTALNTLLGGMLGSGANAMQVGGRSLQGWTGSTWNGQAAHVALWNSLLPAASITALASAGMTGYAGESSGTRAHRYIQYAIPSDLLYTDTGASKMGPGSVTANTTALAALQDVTTSENGNLWVDSEGRVIFAARTRRYVATTSKWTFGENAAGGEIPYEADFSTGYDPTQVQNDWTVTRTGGIVQHVTDQTSRNSFFPRQATRTLNILSDSETIDAANWLLNAYKNAVPRIEELSFNPTGNPTALFPVALGIEIGDRVTVKRRTIAGTQSTDYFVERVQHDISIEQGALSWRVQLQLSPASRWLAWILGDPVYGVLGSTTQLGY